MLLRAACCDSLRAVSEGQDSQRDDSELPERENSSDDVGLEATAQQRVQLRYASNRARASKIHLPSTVFSASQSRPWWLIRYEPAAGPTGHFLAEGRSLRLWVQSQTC
jgi:hypothetical protein